MPDLSALFHPIASRSKKRRMKRLKSIITDINTDYGSYLDLDNTFNTFTTKYAKVQANIKSNIRFGKQIKKITNNTDGTGFNKLDETFKQTKLKLKEQELKLKEQEDEVTKLRFKTTVNRAIQEDREQREQREQRKQREHHLRYPRGYNNGGRKKPSVKNPSKKKLSKKKSPKLHKGPRGGIYIIKKGKKIYQ